VPTLKELQDRIAKQLDSSTMDEAAFTEWLAAETEKAEKLEDSAAKQSKMAYLDETAKAAVAAFAANKRFAIPSESDSTVAVKAAAKAAIAKGTEPAAPKMEPAPVAKSVTTKLTEPAPESIGKGFKRIPDDASEAAVFGDFDAVRGIKFRSDGNDIYRR
jgi:hypothetical protein